MRALVLALALAACGQSAAPPAPNAEVATTSGMDLSGPLIAVGDGFRLDAIPSQNATVLVFPAEEMTVSGPYVTPEATDTGAHVQSNDISLTLTPGICIWEGETYPLTATVQITNSRPLNGCALVRWDHYLNEFLPQIDACIAASPQTTWVTFAGHGDEGDVWVRLQGNGRQVDCQTTIDVSQPSILPRLADLGIAGDGEAIFVRGSSGPNPGGECYEAPEVRSASGELLGWMMDPQGC
jgi:hypothetical protein